jgi:hypothetical protein
MIAIKNVPHFELTITVELLIVLLKASELHYDGACIGAGKAGGILYGFKNTLLLGKEEVIHPVVSFRELDLMLKILEPTNALGVTGILTPERIALAGQFRVAGFNALREANKSYEENKKLVNLLGRLNPNWAESESPGIEKTENSKTQH